LTSTGIKVGSGTVTTLTNLPAVTTDWLTAAGVKADAVTKIQNGLATPTNITAGTITTATSVTNDVGITQAGADKVWGSATRVLTAGTNIALAKGTGLTGLNDIAATAIVSGGAITTSGGAVSTVTTLTNAPSDSSGVTTLLGRIVGTLAAGTHNPQSGDSYTIVANATYGLARLWKWVKNKTVYNKSTDHLYVYDDDDTTPIFNHTMTDDASTATRGRGA